MYLEKLGWKGERGGCWVDVLALALDGGAESAQLVVVKSFGMVLFFGRQGIVDAIKPYCTVL